MALKRRCPGLGLLHHSDQGCTYASEDYQNLLTAHGITYSMSRRGHCYDAVMESFFSTVKSELADRFDSFGEAKMELVDYIEMFYNQRRRHSTLGHVSPAVFERRFATQAAQLTRPRDRIKPSRPANASTPERCPRLSPPIRPSDPILWQHLGNTGRLDSPLLGRRWVAAPRLWWIR